MAFAKTYAVTLTHLATELIAVEVDVSRGLHHFSIVGLGDRTVEEAKERCSLAIRHSGLKSPRQSNEKILISLTPAHIRKTGTAFDLAISVGYLLASGQLGTDVADTVFVGELSLNGDLKRVRGIVPMVQKAVSEGFEKIIIPSENAQEAGALCGHASIIACDRLDQVVDYLSGKIELKPMAFRKPPRERAAIAADNGIRFDHIQGNELAKRALLIALCGGHNICLFGPPGTGKTMLAKAAADTLPDLSFEQQLELTSIYSLSPEYAYALYTRPPFRAPHHSASYVSIVGGGRDILPGEITLSQFGILFLDELPEFDRRVIESLRQPLEEQKVRISRSGGKVEFPCDFQLVCAMNPCPCGYLNTGVRECTCTADQVQKYNRKISGPITDRIDMWVEVSKVSYGKLVDHERGSTGEHARMRKIVTQMRTLQQARYGKLCGRFSMRDLATRISILPQVKDQYDLLASRLRLSARSYANVLKIALTISLLDNRPSIEKEHLLEALSYRPQERGPVA